MPFWNRRREERAAYVRTTGDLLTAGADGLPPVSWIGLDSGGGATPIGPHGPYAFGSAPTQPIITRATALITGPLTAGGFRVVDAVNPGRVQTPGRWLTDPMLCRPDARFPAAANPAVLRLTRSAFWADWVRSAVWWGMGAFVTAEDDAGTPIAGTMRLIHPLLLTTERDQNGALVWVLTDDDSGARAVFDREGRITLGTVRYRLVVLRNPHSPIDSEGHSRGVFEANPAAFRLGSQIEAYTSGTFRSGIPAGYLKVSQPNLSQESADDLKRQWLRNHGGDRRSIAVLNATTEFVPLNLSPVDAALAEVTRLNVADVAFAFALDPMTLGAGLNNSATYSNLRDAWENHRDFGLGLWVAALQDTLTALVAGSQAVRIDMDQFANPAPGERYAAYKTAIDAQILDVDEVRAMEGLPPREAPAAPPAPPQAVPDLIKQPDTPEEPSNAA